MADLALVVFLGIAIHPYQVPPLRKATLTYATEKNRKAVVVADGPAWIGVVLTKGPYVHEHSREFMGGRVFGAQSAQLVSIGLAPEILDLQEKRDRGERKWRNFARWCHKKGIGLPLEAHLLVTTEVVTSTDPASCLPLRDAQSPHPALPPR